MLNPRPELLAALRRVIAETGEPMATLLHRLAAVGLRLPPEHHAPRAARRPLSATPKLPKP